MIHSDEDLVASCLIHFYFLSRRVCEVQLHGDKTFTLRQQKYKVSDQLKTGEAVALFGAHTVLRSGLVSRILLLMQNRLLGGFCRRFPDVIGLGSYPP